MTIKEAIEKLTKEQRQGNIWDKYALTILQNPPRFLPEQVKNLLEDPTSCKKKARCYWIITTIKWANTPDWNNTDAVKKIETELKAEYEKLNDFNKLNFQFLKLIADLVGAKLQADYQEESNNDVPPVMDLLRTKLGAINDAEFNNELYNFICFSDDITDVHEKKRETTCLAFMRLFGIIHVKINLAQAGQNPDKLDARALTILENRTVTLTLSQIICCSNLPQTYYRRGEPLQDLLNNLMTQNTLNKLSRQALLTRLERQYEITSPSGHSENSTISVAEQSWDVRDLAPVCGIVSGSGMIAFGVLAFCFTIGAPYSTLLGSAAIPLGLFLLSFSAAACKQNFKIMASLFDKDNNEVNKAIPQVKTVT